MRLRRPSMNLWLAALAAMAATACATTSETAPATTPAAPSAAPAAPKPAAPAATAAAAVERPASFAICGACHATKADSPPGIGPNLFNIAGKKAGSADGDFDYSDALKGSGKVWTADNLEAFIRAPATAVPGNKMDFPGSPDAKAIAAYVGSLK